MMIKTRTVIIVILAVFFVLFGIAAFLISRYLTEIRQSGPDNAVFVESLIQTRSSGV